MTVRDIVSAGKHLSNTNLSDLTDWLVHTCYQSASSRVLETKYLTQKCFSVKSLIIVSLNTVIPIIVIV